MKKKYNQLRYKKEQEVVDNIISMILEWRETRDLEETIGYQALEQSIRMIIKGEIECLKEFWELTYQPKK